MFPSIKDLTEALWGVVQTLDNLLEEVEEAEAEEAQCDVRLQVQESGWNLRTGDAQYDHDHRGWWGASSIQSSYTREDCRATARDLIDQARDHKAESVPIDLGGEA